MGKSNNPKGVTKSRTEKKSNGTLRNNQDATKPPETSDGIPDPPSWMSEADAGQFREIAGTLNRMRVLAKEDYYAVSLIATEFVDYLKLREVTSREGMTYEQRTENGSLNIRRRPEADLQVQKANYLRQLFKEYGLTAASRSKIEAKKEDSDDILDSLLDG